MIAQKGLVIYHKVDYDGVLSCCIARDSLEKDGLEVDILGFNYGDEIPKIVDLISEYDQIVMVDISFPPEVMLELKEFAKTVEIFWIDHHITAIQDSINNSYDNLPGIRNTKKAACELTWKYFNPNRPIPKVVNLLGRYDVWDKSEGNWDSEILPLQYALRTEYGVSCKTMWEVYNGLIDERPLEDLIEKGKFILKYLNKTWNSAVKNYSFEVTVAGKYRGIAVVATELSSNIFRSVTNDYDIFVVTAVTKSGEIKVSMYSEGEGVMNLGEYMKSNYQGGGHIGAAGGKLTKEQFIELINNHKI